MLWKRALAYLVPFVWTLAPLYGVERLANYYYFAGDPFFFAISGLRLELYIILVLLGSIAAGVLTRNIWDATFSQSVALLAMLFLVNVACDPHVCYSSGSDGLEPLRLGFFLLSVAVSGTWLGVSIRGAKPTKKAVAFTLFFSFVALGYLPVVFTFAGAKLLPPFEPWALALLMFVLAYPVSILATLNLGAKRGFLLPLAAMVFLIVMSVGVAAAYLPLVELDAILIAISAEIGALAGLATASAERSFALHHRAGISLLMGLALLLVVSMTVVIVPDAVNGVFPGGPGATATFSMGVPVYFGAFMDAPPGHAEGAQVTVSFAGTNASVIQEDNFLAGGIGVHSADCCVDGIDYSYRFDLYLFHGGNETLVASAWEACDANAACGGHSWKVLMFLHSEPIGASRFGEKVGLSMSWVAGTKGNEVAWTYTLGGGSSSSFANFSTPVHENPNFNTGVYGGGPSGAQQKSAFFYQFGIMSRYPIGRGGWTVELGCPSVLTSGWNCIQHSETLDGDQSYWKVIWRWGEPYPHVSALATGGQSLLLSYSPNSTTRSFQILW
jgi:hypothetical protein